MLDKYERECEVIDSFENKNHIYSIIEVKGQKFFKKQIKEVTEENKRIIKNEIEKIKLLESLDFIPKIVTYDTEKYTYIIYEYIEGKTLRKTSVQNIINIIDILISICDCIEKIHNLYIIHNDLNPNNIIIDEKKNIHILDFGISSFIGEKIKYGTKRYCSIEQLKNEKANQFFDIYAIGIMFYELLRNINVNVELEKDNNIAYKENLNSSVIEDDHLTQLPLLAEKILAKSTSKSEFRRYSNITEMKIDLIELKNEIENSN